MADVEIVEVPQEVNSLIVVEQLPVIKEQLQSIKIRFAEETAKAQRLVCSEETLKEVRAKRAELTKVFKALEEKRKAAKNAILSPYEEFERVYKECVTDIYKPCDEELAGKIKSVEDELKAQKRKEAQIFFDEYAKNKGIDFVRLEHTGMNITLSSSKKSIHTQIKAFLDKVYDELKLIEVQPYSAEILVEYKTTLNVAQAITRVSERHKAIEEEQRRQESAKAAMEAQEASIRAVEQAAEESAPPKAEDFMPPTIEEPDPTEERISSESPAMEKEYETTFKVTGTLVQLKALKAFLEEGGYSYECK